MAPTRKVESLWVNFVQDKAEILNDPFITSPSKSHTNRPKYHTVRQISVRPRFACQGTTHLTAEYEGLFDRSYPSSVWESC